MTNRRVLAGTVVGEKMDKTIVVAVTSRKLHGVYRKYVNRTKKLKAHDENNECSVGDAVRVIESRPISKEKRWCLLEIPEKAK